jgi:TPP-dependent pyruvate/acetoin dehydrogenase alpha subunit
MTYRYHGHHVGDINREYYRSKDEEKDWKENDRDPIIRFAQPGLGRRHRDGGRDRGDQRRDRKADAAAAVAYAEKRPTRIGRRGRHACLAGRRHAL